jgi:DNA-binding NarL/FixJ family response regulator
MDTLLKETDRTRIRILILDNQKIMREGLHSLLDKLPDVKLVAEAENADQALRLINELTPDIAIIDVTPSLNGVEATRRILARKGTTTVVALSASSERRFVLEMLKAGASGYLLKDCDFDELNKAIHITAQGRTYITPGVLDTIIKDHISWYGQQHLSGLKSLTGRQYEVFQLLAEGKTPREIAQIMSCSVTTIDSDRQQITKKLNISSVAGLTKYAICEGVTSIDDQKS